MEILSSNLETTTLSAYAVNSFILYNLNLCLGLTHTSADLMVSTDHLAQD